MAAVKTNGRRGGFALIVALGVLAVMGLLLVVAVSSAGRLQNRTIEVSREAVCLDAARDAARLIAAGAAPTEGAEILAVPLPGTQQRVVVASAPAELPAEHPAQSAAEGRRCVQLTATLEPGGVGTLEVLALLPAEGAEGDPVIAQVRRR